MLDLLFETTKDENIYIKYHDTLEKEYAFWMNGEEKLENGSAVKE
jgi:alpha,alpha-trehalase